MTVATVERVGGDARSPAGDRPARDASFARSPLSILASLRENRRLLLRMIRREVQQRYRGSMLGDTWALLTPLAMLAAYTFAFNVVFKARWSAAQPSTAEFALNLFIGIAVYTFLSECLAKAPSLVTSQVSFVKKVVFPLETLAWIAVAAALVQLAISIVLWCGAVIIAHHGISPAVLLAPLILLPLVLTALGLVWLLSALGVYLRDIGQGVGLLTMAIMFLSPIFYPVEALPAGLQPWMAINPMAFALESLRGAAAGALPAPGLWLAHLAGGALALWLGYAIFQSTRRGFADVL